MRTLNDGKLDLFPRLYTAALYVTCVVCVVLGPMNISIYMVGSFQNAADLGPSRAKEIEILLGSRCLSSEAVKKRMTQHLVINE